MIHLDGVGWTYPHAAAPSLLGVDLHVAAGELVVLCGASGSGKSTVLRVMNGLIPHAHDGGVLSGTVRVAGVVTAGADLDEIGLSVGTVLQHPRRQFFTDSTADELAFALENFGTPRDVTLGRVTAELARLAEAVPVGQRLSAMSGGQQQQVAITAATAHGPAVLLLDEPSSNLSADAVARLVAVLRDLKARGVTVVIAEHRLRYLQGLLDRVVVMRHGAVDAVWSAAQFGSVRDSTLAAEGLRGDVRTAELPHVAATGPSVVPRAGDREASSSSSQGVRLREVRCRLGGRLVLAIDDAVLDAGRVTAVRGVNGAGKTTLARILVGLERCGGRVLLDGRATNARERLRSAAIVMQDVQRQLFTESVGAELSLARAGSTAAAELDVDEMLGSLDLAHLADRHPLSLSGGQQQRVVVAAVRLARRRIVVFDEPSSGVDRRHLASIADQVRQVAAEGAVVVLISHDEDLVARAADQQLVLTPVPRAPRD